jgi:hypothetical protein
VPALAVGYVGGSFAILPPAAEAAPVLRHTVQEEAVVDSRGNRWQPARRVFRGGVNRYITPGASSGSPILYQYARSGVRRIKLRVPRRGRYAVVLYLADPSPAPHRRVFHVNAEGRRARRRVVVHNAPSFDFLRTRFPDQRQPLHAIFESVVRDRALNIRFRGVRGKPVVTAVEARRLGPARMRRIRPLWRDDFSGPEGRSPDPGLWRHETGAVWAHEELQAHTDRPENSSLDGNGHLDITARRERNDTYGETRDYTSARLAALPPVSLRRAAISGRIRHPEGAGLWSIFWFWGSQEHGFRYPYNGELNVTEYDYRRRNELNSFFHFGEAVGENGARDSQWLGGRRMSRPLSSHFLTFGVRSVPGAVELSVSGKRHSSWTKADVPVRGRWVFGKNPFTLMLSMGVGGDYVGGAPPPSTRFPAVMKIDYISVKG